MEQLLDILRSSTDNDLRKASIAHLRQIQEQHPEEFIAYTWSGISSPEVPQDIRFFLCTTVISFVEHTWHNGVDKETQERVLLQYIQLAVSESFPTTHLARKVGMIVALMAKRGAGRAMPHGLPPLVRAATDYYARTLMSRCMEGEGGFAGLPQLLLMIHLFLKDIQTKRVGHVFEKVCREFVSPVTAVFTALSPLSPLAHYDAYLYLFKCSLRVFGCGVFEDKLYIFLLDATWQLTADLSPDEASTLHSKRARLLEYAVKTQEKMVTYFPSMLHTLPPEFFIGHGGDDDHSLLRLVCAIVETRTNAATRELLSEKCMCRAMRLLTCLFAAEDGDTWIAQCIATLCQSPLLPPLMRNMICGFLADDTSSAAMREWSGKPEKVVSEFDIDIDDEASPVSCTEQLFLAMTSSTVGAALSLTVAWSVVNELLAAGGEEGVTAALHAIGVGYYTMADAQNPANYLEFLSSRLLPILRMSSSLNAAERPTLFVLRRVVWLVGMWCESVTSPLLRREVHVALEEMLQQHTDIVIVLTALRTIQNFISDNCFSRAELAPTSVQTILRVVQQVLPHLRSPTSVKEVAGLVYVLIEKEVVTAQGAFILSVFTPAIILFIENHALQTTVESPSGSEDDFNMSCLTMLLDCLASAVRVCSDDSVMWSLFHPVVCACTTLGRPVTPWSEDSAWELLLTIARSSQIFLMPTAQEALQWTERHRDRDFAMLHTVVRTQATLLMLRQQSVEDLYTGEAIHALISALVKSPSPELQSAYSFLLLVISYMSTGPLRGAVVQRCIERLVAYGDVQVESSALQLGVLLAAALLSSPPSHASHAIFAEGVHNCPSLPEQIVLLLDVSTSQLTTNALLSALRHMQQLGSLSADNASMVRVALDGASVIVQPSGVLGDNDQEVRSPEEMLLELIGDEEVAVTSPHARRLFGLFSSLLRCR